MSGGSALTKVIPRRPSVAPWLGIVIALAFALLVVPTITADRWMDPHVVAGDPVGMTVRVAPFAGAQTEARGGGIVVERGEVATPAHQKFVDDRRATTNPTTNFLAYLLLVTVLASIFTHHMRRSNRGRLARVQVVSLAGIVVIALVLKIVLLVTTASILIVPIAGFALVPTLVLDRIVGLATGVLAALIVSFIGPFDLGIACLFLVQASVAGLVIAERPKHLLRATLVAGAATTVCTAVTYPVLVLLTQGHLPANELGDVLHSPWYAATVGPAIATLIAVPLVPLYQLLVGEITHGQLVELEDLSNPMLKQIAERSPGTWQHSLTMANMAEVAANVIGANGRLVRVGAYYHDLGKSLQPKYFIENLEAGETSPHDQLPPEVSCDAIFAHVTEGIVAARKAGLHERIVDFMHMHHGNGVLEYFWGKVREGGNPRGLTVERFRYPGHPPQSRETAILAICDAVEAASRTLKKPEPQAIDNLVQRIIYGKLHLGQLDESGLSMSDLRKIAESLRDTIRHANHGRIEYPWQREEAAAAAAAAVLSGSASAAGTNPRLDSLDRGGPGTTAERAATTAPAKPRSNGKPGDDVAALAETAELGKLARPNKDLADALGDAAVDAPIDAPIDATVSIRRSSSLIAEPVVPAPTPAEPTPAPSPAVEPVAAASSASEPPPIEFEALTPPPRAAQGEDVIELRRPRAATQLPFSPDAIVPARKRAATLPPTPSRRSPTIPPPRGTLSAEPRTRQASGPRARPPNETTLGRPATSVRPFTGDELDNAVTNPPPTSRVARVDEWSDHPPAKDPETLEMSMDVLEALAGESGRTMESMPRMVEPALTVGPPPEQVDVTRPRLLLPLTAPASNPAIALPERSEPPWSSGLAARIDAVIDDDFGGETPVVAPTKAELRALLGQPDPTREVSLEEIQARVDEDRDLQRREDEQSEVLRRRVHPTHEVDPDDIDQIAPLARRQGSIGVAKKKKPE
ncbi:MAG: HDIG domain-containing protein [Proteobacteria bacterium]|nr:HDIG domain-containing protein [Pseudomonadota bacterium]